MEWCLRLKKLKESDLAAWIYEYTAAAQFRVSEDASQLLADYVGNDLSRLSNELEKIFISKKKGEEISKSDVESQVGISREYNAFELCRALAIRDLAKVYRITDYLARNTRSNPFVMTLGALFAYFQKYFVFLHSEENEAISKLKLWPAVVSEYRTARRHYDPSKSGQILRLLYEFDLRSKGINDSGTDEGSLLKELVFQILH